MGEEEDHTGAGGFECDHVQIRAYLIYTPEWIYPVNRMEEAPGNGDPLNIIPLLFNFESTILNTFPHYLDFLKMDPCDSLINQILVLKIVLIRSPIN